MPDIRANIIRMLQQGEHEGMTVGEQTDQEQPDAATSTPRGEEAQQEDLFSRLESQQEKKSAPDADAAAVAGEAEEKAAEPYVPLPTKQITIQDLDDLKKLSREFDAAKKRQRGE